MENMSNAAKLMNKLYLFVVCEESPQSPFKKHYILRLVLLGDTLCPSSKAVWNTFSTICA